VRRVAATTVAHSIATHNWLILPNKLNALLTRSTICGCRNNYGGDRAGLAAPADHTFRRARLVHVSSIPTGRGVTCSAWCSCNIATNTLFGTGAL
jgi:hypothetical protein